MSGILGTAVTGAGATGYTIEKSVRLRASASAYLSRTPASAGNRKTWTYSCWLKKATNGGGTAFFNADYGDPYANGYISLGFWSDASRVDSIWFDHGPEGSRGMVYTNAKFRDPSSWYHIVVVMDTTQATDTNRVKIYVNGVQQSCSTVNSGYPSQNFEGLVNGTGAHAIGRRERSNDNYFDGYLTEINFIDGQALTPSSFGESNATTGVWQPKAYTGTYGTNGFYLKYTDVATTSGSNAGLGKDFSGNGNYWNTNNISVTSGATYDSMTDVPTLTSATVANFCTINPLDNYYMGGTISDGNLQILTGYSSTTYIRGTQGVSSGKWYYEVTLSAVNGNTWCGVGWASKPSTSTSDNTGSIAYVGADGTVNGAAGGPTYGVGDTIGVMIDLDNNLAYFSKNGTLINSGNGFSVTAASSTTTGFYYPALADYDATGTKTWVANFGQRPFAYTPPTGFLRLNTYNLPTPVIPAGNKYMDAVAYTGDGSTSRTVSGYNFQPDFVWAKGRSNAESHNLADAVRGFSVRLFSNLTNAEESNTYAGTTAINGAVSNGFTTGSNTNVNGNGTTYVGWCWKANGSGSSNTSGSITSTVSVNTTSGFSIVTWTGVGGSGTVGHGLGSAPKMIIDMPRNFVSDKYVYHASLGATNYLSLNLTSASGSTTLWNNTSPTSSVFSVNGNGSNGNGNTYVAYCFAEVAGFSKFGSYTGNGSSDGPFIYCGFRPRYVVMKAAIGNTGNWGCFDTSRDTYNIMSDRLELESSAAENTGTPSIDFTSNGFKIRTNNGTFNYSSSVTYIYFAFAENPFKYSLAR